MKILLATASAAALTNIAAPATASAQTSGQPDAYALPEILVTARKKAERLQDAPISITAYTAEAIERAGVRDIADIASATPGMQYGDFGDLKLSPTSLRGVVSGAGSAGAEPAVGYYVDDIYVGQGPGANLDLYDIERVEVLRGPQGALFGRNTIGGAISITTQRPTDSFSASAEAGAGAYDQRRFAGSVSGPILGENVLGKLAIIKSRRDGYDRNTVLDQRINDASTLSGRAQLLFRSGGETELLLTGAYREADQHPLGFESLSANPAAAVAQLYAAYGLAPNTDPYDRRVQADTQSRETLQAYDGSAHFSTRVGSVGVTNILAYHEHSYFSRTDTDRSPFRLLYDGDPERVKRWSEELRFDLSTGAIDWIAGLYYFDQTSQNQSFVEIGADLADIFGDRSIAGLVTGSNGRLRTRSLAGFASMSWKASERLDVTAGLRYTRDRKSIDYVQNDPVGLFGGAAAIRGADAWSELTPSANLRYRVTQDAIAYVTASKGFKSGGFNDALGDANGIGYGPELLWNYEAGLKGTLFERRVSFDLAVFYMDWSDIQLTTDNPSTVRYDPIIRNAGAAHSQGIEGQIAGRVSESLELGANFNIQDARYDEGALPTPPGQPLQPLRRTLYSPTYTGAINATYTWPTPLGDVVIFGEFLQRGPAYMDLSNTPDGRIDAYGLINARASLEFGQGRYRLSAWGRNLGGVTRAQRLFDLYGQEIVGQKFIMLNEPRTWGVELKVSF